MSKKTNIIECLVSILCIFVKSIVSLLFFIRDKLNRSKTKSKEYRKKRWKEVQREVEEC